MSTAQTLPALLNASELARMLGVSRKTIWVLNRSGRVPEPVRLIARDLWRREEIERWLAAGTPSRERWAIVREAQR